MGTMILALLSLAMIVIFLSLSLGGVNDSRLALFQFWKDTMCDVIWSQSL